MLGREAGGTREQQADTGHTRGLYVCLVTTLIFFWGSCGWRGRMTEAASSLYVRTDTDRTTVVSPQVRAAAVVEDKVAIEASETVDAWTGASVDIVTAATGTVRERRYESNARLTWLGDRFTVAGAYRHSTEPDYLSHGGQLHAAAEFANRNTTLALTLFGGLDTVGRAGDPGFQRALRQTGARLGVIQVLGQSTLGQAQWETSYLDGFQGSPYRFVAIGVGGSCVSAAPFCVPETVPDARFRHAPMLRFRQALGKRASLGMGYRLYFDSWDLWSHTFEPDLTFLVGANGTLTVSYRYYTQDEASFYRPRYLNAALAGFHTRDRKLSAFFTNGAGVSYVHAFAVDDSAELQFGARANVTHFRYLAFLGLAEVWALETTGFLALTFD